VCIASTLHVNYHTLARAAIDALASSALSVYTDRAVAVVHQMHVITITIM
jgi:hypothetical protein